MFNASFNLGLDIGLIIVNVTVFLFFRSIFLIPLFRSSLYNRVTKIKQIV